MKTYNITYYINDADYLSNNEGCGCSDHNYHGEHTCGCETHEHDNDNSCGCAHDSSYVDSEPKIQAKIRSFGAWAQIMPESFIVKSEFTAEEMYKELESVSNTGDLLFVSCISSDNTAYSNPALADWFNK